MSCNFQIDKYSESYRHHSYFHIIAITIINVLLFVDEGVGFLPTIK